MLMIRYDTKYKPENIQDMKHSALFSTQEAKTQHPPFKKMH